MTALLLPSVLTPPVLTRPALATIGLEELNQGAALQSRVDTKYLVGAAFAANLPGVLPAGSRILQIGGLSQFAYQSVYFDTPDLLTYRQSATKRRRRFKVRTRAYLDSHQTFLEVKVRGPRGITEKARVLHDFDRLRHLSREDREFIASVLAHAGIEPAPVADLSPYLLTAYRRTTYVSPGRMGPTRTTVDTDLTWAQLRGEVRAQAFRPTLAVVETKSRFASNPVGHALWRSGVRPGRFSKYCTGAAFLDSSLPANKWQRGLAALRQ